MTFNNKFIVVLLFIVMTAHFFVEASAHLIVSSDGKFTENGGDGNGGGVGTPTTVVAAAKEGRLIGRYNHRYEFLPILFANSEFGRNCSIAENDVKNDCPLNVQYLDGVLRDLISVLVKAGENSPEAFRLVITGHASQEFQGNLTPAQKVFKNQELSGKRCDFVVSRMLVPFKKGDSLPEGASSCGAEVPGQNFTIETHNRGISQPVMESGKEDAEKSRRVEISLIPRDERVIAEMQRLWNMQGSVSAATPSPIRPAAQP